MSKAAADRVATIAKHVLSEVRPEPFRPNRACNVLDSYMTYVERPGSHKSKCLVFLHGNPANSYLWRKVVNEVEGKLPFRMLYPDLIGHGRSGDSKRGYDFFTHYNYLSAWFEEVVKEKEIILCLHDWGSGLGFHYAKNNPSRIAGIVHMESIIGPLASWDEFPAIGRKAFQNLREPGIGEAMIFEKNFFLERLLLGEPWAASLGEEGSMPYRERFTSVANRAPTLYWPRQIPIKGGGLAQKVIEASQEWESFLAKSEFPKMFIPAEPGFFSPVILEKVKSWRNHKVAPAVNGVHFIQEQSGAEIGRMVVDFASQFK